MSTKTTGGGVELLERTINCADKARGVAQLLPPRNGGGALEFECVMVYRTVAFRRIVGEEAPFFRAHGGRRQTAEALLQRIRRSEVGD